MEVEGGSPDEMCLLNLQMRHSTGTRGVLGARQCRGLSWRGIVMTK